MCCRELKSDSTALEWIAMYITTIGIDLLILGQLVTTLVHPRIAIFLRYWHFKKCISRMKYYSLNAVLVLLSTSLHCTIIDCTEKSWAALLCLAIVCNTLNISVLHCSALHCTALQPAALNCAVLHLPWLHCTVLNIVYYPLTTVDV